MGGTPLPLPLRGPPKHPRDLWGDYKSARAVVWPFCPNHCLVDVVWWCSVYLRLVFKMVDPRRRVEGGGLQSLDSIINERGLENVSEGYPEPRVRLDDHPVRMTSPRSLDVKYLRRYRRLRLNQGLVDGFVNNYCFMMLDEENFLQNGRRQKQVMGAMLVRQILPWIRDNLFDCLDESRWPLQMNLFWALDDLLQDKFPKVHLGACWQAIAQCYQRIQTMQAWVEEEP